MYPPRKPEPHVVPVTPAGKAAPNPVAFDEPVRSQAPLPAKGSPGGASSWSVGEPGARHQMTDAELTTVLDERRLLHAEEPDWKNSVEGLLQLFDMAHDDAAREALAFAMGYDRDTADKAGRNLWLHAQLLKHLAANGGDMPEKVRALARGAIEGSTSSH